MGGIPFINQLLSISPLLASNFHLYGSNEAFLEALDVEIPLECYSITTHDITTNSFSNKSSLYSFTNTGLPEFNWLPWKFKSLPKKYWHNEENIKFFLQWFVTEFRIKDPCDWYKISWNDFISCGAKSLFNYYKSPISFITSQFSDHNFIIWKFKYVPLGFWKSIQSRRRYVEWLGEELGFLTPDAWYSIGKAPFSSNYGSVVLRTYYEDCPPHAIMTLFSEMDFIPWCFATIPSHFWKEEKNRRAYVVWLGNILGYKNTTDWYSLSQKQVIENHGATILKHYYANSPSKLVLEHLKEQKSEEEEMPLHPWAFSNAPKYLWRDKIQRSRFLKWLGDLYHVRKEDDWFNFHLQYHLKTQYPTLLKLYPNSSPMEFILENMQEGFHHKFKSAIDGYKELWRSGWHTKSEKRVAGLLTSHFFPSEQNFFRFSINFENYLTELDIYFPYLSIAFEYQGEQHFFNTQRVTQEARAIRKRDETKSRICKMMAITLFPVTFFQFGNGGKTQLIKNLKAQILQLRPDLLVEPLNK